jgi:hypothetical protein
MPGLTRVIGRASVVLLSSHFERYVYGINEDASTFLNASGASGSLIPEFIRLLHTRTRIDDIGRMEWSRRSRALADLVLSDAWLWGGGVTGALDHQRLLSWMKSPKPKEVERFYRYWGIPNIFALVETTTHPQAHLRLKLGELVDKRNGIAHGDLATEATQADVSSYLDVVKVFCTRADSEFASHLGSLVASGPSW